MHQGFFRLGPRIVGHTLRTWGDEQAIRYSDNLEACCQMVADNPELGRASDNIRPGLRRIECGRHVVFYRHQAGGILVSRILHHRMLPEIHIDEETEAA